jgi:hypothetical protein
MVVLNYHIDKGIIDGVDVSGLTFGIVADTPPIMIDGNWRVGVLIDDKATSEQASKMGEIISGQQGGPPAMLTPLISEMLGVEMVPVTYSDDGDRHKVQWGDMVAMEVEDFHAGPMQETVQLHNVFHPSNSTLTVATSVGTSVSAFGIEFGQEGTSGASAPFSWSGE